MHNKILTLFALKLKELYINLYNTIIDNQELIIYNINVALLVKWYNGSMVRINR